MGRQIKGELAHDGLLRRWIVDLFDFVFVEVMEPDIGLEVIGQWLLGQVAVQFTHFSLVDSLGFAYHVYKWADIVDEEAENDAAHYLDEGDKESFYMVFVSK